MPIVLFDLLKMRVNAVPSPSWIRHLFGHSRSGPFQEEKLMLRSAFNPDSSGVQDLSGSLCRTVVVIPNFAMLCNVLFLKLIAKLKLDGIQYR
jgi:hypothetical protein